MEHLSELFDPGHAATEPARPDLHHRDKRK